MPANLIQCQHENGVVVNLDNPFMKFGTFDDVSADDAFLEWRM